LNKIQKPKSSGILVHSSTYLWSRR